MRNRSIGWAVTLLLILVLILTSAGCGGKEEGSSEVVTLKLGVSLPLTGAASYWGIGWQHGIELAVDDINEQGGFEVDGQKYTFKVIEWDDKGSATEAVAGAKKLVEQDQVQYMIGPILTGGMLAVYPTTEAAKVICLGAGSSPERLGPTKPHMFSINMTGKEYGPALFQYIRDNYPDAKTFYGMASNDETGWSDVQVFTPRLKAMGFQLIGWELYDPATTDFYPVLTKIMAKNPAIICYGTALASKGPLIMKQLHELGYAGIQLWPAGTEPSAVLNQVGADALNGQYMTWFDYTQDYLILDTEKEMRDRAVARFGSTGYDISRVVEGGWDGVQFLVEGMKAAGTVEDTDAIAEAISNLTIQLPDGEKTFGGMVTFGIKRMSVGDVMIAQWQQGVYKHLARIRPEVP
jgi:branched-chain amino acid transport system substrate-binding protein